MFSNSKRREQKYKIVQTMTTRKRRRLSETLAVNPTVDDNVEEEVEDYMSMEIVEPRVVETPASRALKKRRQVRGFFLIFPFLFQSFLLFLLVE